MSCAGQYLSCLYVVLELRSLVLGCVRDRRWYEIGEAGFGGHLGWVGVLMGHCVNANCRTIFFFSSCRN